MNRNPVLTASLVEGRACRPFVQAEMFYEWLVDLSWLASAASSKQRRRKPTSSQSPYQRHNGRRMDKNSSSLYIPLGVDPFSYMSLDPIPFGIHLAIFRRIQ